LIRWLRSAWARRRRYYWEREAKRSLGACGEGVVLRAYSTFVCPERIHVGSNVFIGENAWLRADAGVRIGENTVISRNCTIFTAIHDYKGAALPYDENFIARPVTIGRNVWIGMNVNITPGVSIGDGAIVGLATHRRHARRAAVGDHRRPGVPDPGLSRQGALRGAGQAGGLAAARQQARSLAGPRARDRAAGCGYPAWITSA
jgi:acetyltransferase-like isoleucine patch superfamily enzyme